MSSVPDVGPIPAGSLLNNFKDIWSDFSTGQKIGLGIGSAALGIGVIGAAMAFSGAALGINAVSCVVWLATSSVVSGLIGIAGSKLKLPLLITTIAAVTSSIFAGAAALMVSMTGLHFLSAVALSTLTTGIVVGAGAFALCTLGPALISLLLVVLKNKERSAPAVISP